MTIQGMGNLRSHNGLNACHQRNSAESRNGMSALMIFRNHIRSSQLTIMPGISFGTSLCELSLAEHVDVTYKLPFAGVSRNLINN